MSGEGSRRQADVLRQVPLETVLRSWGAVRDRRDRSKWHTEQGPLSVSGCKFINWRQSRGGGGAIDLVMHLGGLDYRSAVAWLQRQVACGVAQVTDLQPARHPIADPLRLPAREGRLLPRVERYLTQRRHLSSLLVDSLLQSGRCYADCHGNAVFPLVAGKANRPVGAELRGTGDVAWRGMAPGTRKDLGYFWVGRQGARDIVLCESAIDAISCFQLFPQSISISTSGVRSNPHWLGPLITRGYTIHCGFDADAPGDDAARRMIARHPSVQRLRPPAHDWNDALTAQLCQS